MSQKQRFQQVVNSIRSDLKYLKENLVPILKKKRAKDLSGRDEEVRNWILDVFLDKLFEINAKIEKILEEFEITRDLPIWDIKRHVEDIAISPVNLDLHLGGRNLDIAFSGLMRLINSYELIVERSIGTVRKIFHDQGWEDTGRIEPEDYILPIKRAKYVKAREELEKAKQAVKNERWDEVLNHLRPAIDLSIKERFGFAKIQPMKKFLSEAKKYNFPLPSYTTIYHYFDEGSQRIHQGKLNTTWECEKALDFVAGFIDRLELLEVTPEEIEEFKKKSKAVN